MTESIPETPHPSAAAESPNYELLRGCGWAVGAVAGRYCVAWRGSDEVVLVWRHGQWRQLAGRGAVSQAA